MGDYQTDEEELRIMMRDGVSLQCRLYRPVPAEPDRRYPVLLNYCTDISAETEMLFRHCSSGGFIGLVLLFRGRGKSGGEFSLGSGVSRDLEDFFRWLQEQRWYGGRCAFCGGGAGATFALQFAQAHPDWIHGLVLSPFILNYDRRGMCTNGVFHLSCLRRLVELAWSSPACRKDSRRQRGLAGMREQFSQYARYWPFSSGSTPLSLLPEYEEIALDFGRKTLSGEQEMRSRYTQEQFFAGFPDTPVLLFGCWGDERLRGILKTYYELSYRRNRGAQCFIAADAGCFSCASEQPFQGASSFRDYVLGWLRHWLCGEENPRFAEKKICCQLLEPVKTSRRRAAAGDGFRLESPFWPPGEQELFFYLQKGQRLSTLYSRTDGSREGASFFSDPLHPVAPEAGHAAGRFPADPLLQNFLPYLRGDTLIFVSSPLKKGVVLAGSVRIRLYLHCTAPDGDIFCRLSCLESSGRSSRRPAVPRALCESIQRISSYRQTKIASGSQPEYCRLYEFGLSAVAAVLPEGCRLQLELSGSCFPVYAVSNQTGIEDLRGITGPVAYYRIYHNPQCPSCLILPVLPRGIRRLQSPSHSDGGRKSAAVGANQNKGEKTWRI